MTNITHNNVFEMLSVDMDIPQNEIKDILLSKGTDDFIHYIKNQDLWIHKTELILTKEVKDIHGKILINSGISINKYLVSLLERYVKDDKFTTSELSIECTDPVLSMYRDKSYKKINNIMDNYIYKEDTALLLLEKDKNIKTSFNNSVEQIISTPKGICTFLKMLENFKENKSSILNSLRSSLITLGLASYSGNKNQESCDILSVKSGILCILQNISEVSGDQLCGLSSPDIVKMLVNDDAMEQALALYGNITDDAAPIFSDAVNRHNYYLRILVTVNLFVELIAESNTDAHNLEVHKALHELAERRYADLEITTLLSKLFLPEVKHLILQEAYEIKKKCVNCPIIWSTVGDMLPVRFLCTTESCDYSGSHKTLISNDVIISAKGIQSTSVIEGLYYSCNMLTSELQDYYKSVVKATE
ncbi:MAG: hypothetical protein C0603_02020 [Denitrovibrio sp.]|nr:MAG: hypothetical protein C0603_02020 [Denitrovibrio sp.]